MHKTRAYTLPTGRGIEMPDGRKLFLHDTHGPIVWDRGLWRDLDERRADHIELARTFNVAHGISREDD